METVDRRLVPMAARADIPAMLDEMARLRAELKVERARVLYIFQKKGQVWTNQKVGTFEVWCTDIDAAIEAEK